MRIFTWPKVIFLYPTAIVSLICWAGMWIIHDRTHDPTKPLIDAVDLKHLSAEHTDAMRDLSAPLKGSDLQLMSAVPDANAIPTHGKNVFVVASVNDTLHFRMFDGDGKMVEDTDEKKLTEHSKEIEVLKKQVAGLWPPHKLTGKEKDQVISDLASIVDHAPMRQVDAKVKRFETPQNLLAMLFLGMLAFNLLVMALDFPRFALVAWILAGLLALFVFLWIGSFFEFDLMKPIHWIFANIYAVANRGFYLMVFVTLFIVFAIIYVTRWLDYWEILPNEILHHHGPLSDLERYPTMNLKFDKEIPDVLEWALLGSGRLVLHVPNVSKALVLDNVLFITAKENALKKVMSRLDVRVTTDQEAGESVT